MALSVQSANLVRQKAFNSVENAPAYVAHALKAFFHWWATHKSNNDLQFLAVDAATATTGDGQDFGIDAAHQVYFIYIKKRATGTDSYFQLYDDADNDSEVIADRRISAALLEANDYFVAVYPEGLVMADGIVATFETAINADSGVQSSEADAGDGFIIIGA